MDPEVPPPPPEEGVKVGRGRSSLRRFPVAELFKIALMIVALIAVVALRRDCARGVSGLFNAVAPDSIDARHR